MKNIKFVSLLACFLLLVGCGTAGGNNNNGSTGSNETNNEVPDEEPIVEEEAVEDLTGYIVSIANDGNVRILVTGQPAGGSGESATMYTLEDSTVVENSNEDVMESGDLAVGMKVTVWNNGITAHSFPGQSGAVRVVVDADQDEHEQHAVAKALEEVESGQPWHVDEVVSEDEQHYNITLRNLLDGSDPVEVNVEL
ncbi:YobA family protein [Sutcliffiella rhizosphaerae]|uniref:DUF5666 domain-containing protein n=1 Tax=Sutcliffiella rhizosphaerae TaxID=2880967 RepID=A0ABM8YNG5_9BACI|nr:YobA family protein [Sutcliffiella rhizosphaerae]CAG9621523.1 hypothetical protein BACCIP111883_02296 [Sutcliffiella rhizosphaerae]